MAWLMCLVLACLVNFSVEKSLPSSDSYVAAVVEYPLTENTTDNLLNYRRYIQEAAEQDADIIVFPELTLSVMGEIVEVPVNGSLLDFPIPALSPELYHEVLVSISEAARLHQIYVVINIEENLNCTTPVPGEDCPESTVYLFNTNVVFDRFGRIIDRFRKINLFFEPYRSPSLTPELGVFSTDFGVTFGHFICFDMLFRVPGLQVVQRMNITDVVMTTMWFSELPYLTGVQIQEAYAVGLNVNFLASGANNVFWGSAGSGIYSGAAGALASTMPGQPATRLLVARVPKVPGEVAWPVAGPTVDPPTAFENLFTFKDPSLLSHVTRRLVPGFQEFILSDREVSCAFRINVTHVNAVNIYNYRAGVFSGVRDYPGVATGGARVCSVFACTNENITSCGERYPSYSPGRTGIFSELTIIATVPTPVIDPVVQAGDSSYFPVSVDTSMKPLRPDYYSYSNVAEGNVTMIALSVSENNAELYSVAIWGRYYATDGEEADPPRDHDVPEDTTENPVTDGATEGLTDGTTEGVTDGVTEGVTDGVTEGVTDAVPDAASDHLISVF